MQSKVLFHAFIMVSKVKTRQEMWGERDWQRVRVFYVIFGVCFWLVRGTRVGKSEQVKTQSEH